MLKPVHRPVTDEEKREHPDAFTFREDTGTFHNKEGFPLRSDSLRQPQKEEER